MGTAVAEHIDVEFAEAGETTAGAGSLATINRANTAVAVTAHGGGFMSLIEKAVDKGDLTMVEKMMGLQERWEGNEAIKAFNNALAAAKAEIKPIIKNRTVKFEARGGGAGTSYDHEDIAGIADQIDEILARHGLFYRWRLNNDAETGLVTVGCVVSHQLGYSEETPLSGKIDTSGSKNHLQAVGSAVTYLERYTLKAALGLASKHDDDGRAAGSAVRDMRPEPQATPLSGEVLGAKQIASLQAMIVERGVNIAPFIAWVRRAPGCKAVEKLGDIPVEFYEGCVEEIKKRFPLPKEAK